MIIRTHQQLIQTALLGGSFTIRDGQLESTSGSPMARFNRGMQRLSCYTDTALRASKLEIQNAMLRILSEACPDSGDFTPPPPPEESIYPGTLAIQLINHMLSRQAGNRLDPHNPITSAVISSILDGHEIPESCFPALFKRAVVLAMASLPVDMGLDVGMLQRATGDVLMRLTRELREPSERLCGPAGTLLLHLPLVDSYISGLASLRCTQDRRIHPGTLRRQLLEMITREAVNPGENLPQAITRMISRVVANMVRMNRFSDGLGPDPAPRRSSPALRIPEPLLRVPGPKPTRAPEILYNQIVEEMLEDIGGTELVKKILREALKQEKATTGVPLRQAGEIERWAGDMLTSLLDQLNKPQVLLRPGGHLNLELPLAKTALCNVIEAVEKNLDSETRALLLPRLTLKLELTELDPKAPLVMQLVHIVNGIKLDIQQAKREKELAIPADQQLLTDAEGLFDTDNPDFRLILAAHAREARAQNPRLETEVVFECLRAFFQGQPASDLELPLEDHIRNLTGMICSTLQDITDRSPGRRPPLPEILKKIFFNTLQNEAQNFPNVPDSLIRLLIIRLLNEINYGKNLFQSLNRARAALTGSLRKLTEPETIEIPEGRMNSREFSLESLLMWGTQRRPSVSAESRNPGFSGEFFNRIRDALTHTPPALIPGALPEYLMLLQNALLLQVSYDAAGIPSLPSALSAGNLMVTALAEQHMGMILPQHPDLPAHYTQSLRQVLATTLQGRGTTPGDAAPRIRALIEEAVRGEFHPDQAATPEGTLNPRHIAVQVAVGNVARNVETRHPELSHGVLLHRLLMATPSLSPAADTTSLTRFIETDEKIQAIINGLTASGQ